MHSALALHSDWINPPDAQPPLEAPGPMCLAEMSDYGLARAAAAHDMRALGELYERHKHRVYAVCTRMTHNPALADDLTQEVFLSLVHKIGSYRGESQFTTWLHRLTVNCVLMYFRRPSRRESNFSDLDNVIPIAPRLTTPPARLPDTIAFRSAIAQLPRGCRTVFVLFAIAGYEHEEIAKLLGLSAGTSKSQLHRARVRLRQLLAIKLK
ncbi:MAG TPA: sigma-70 family RNA polymerase sigma factor [Pyrinomonadaceae bacterium]|nr:sigma-70 family RNA polymerase sigma factor [Pyrinomonadaceae bacterium]